MEEKLLPLTNSRSNDFTNRPNSVGIQNVMETRISLGNSVMPMGQSNLAMDPLRLDFKDINYDVKIKGGYKRILNNVSGFVLPGEIMYIMGPSGGGKTTLLDFLNNRTQLSPENSVYLNGCRWKEKEFRKVARYCEQYPKLYEVLTVRETFMFAASFFTRTKKDRDLRVQKVLELLGLEAQAETMIGGNVFRGISGGQKQRVSVGEQLVANPKLLFLDEPTSGLDSTSAFQLIDNLKRICKKTKLTIVCSIHQPSQRVFDLSDRQLFLAGGKQYGGNIVYHGRTDEINQYFETIGIPNKTNCATSEWLLDQANGDFGDPDTVQKMITKYQESELKRNTMLELEYIDTHKEGIQDYEVPGHKKSMMKDLMWLSYRGILTNLKNPMALGIRLLTYCFMSLALGATWSGIAKEPKGSDQVKITDALFFASSFFSVMTICVMPTYIEDRKIMVKERVNGVYKLWVYSISNLIVSIPFTFILALCAGVILFYMIGLHNDHYQIFYFVFNMFVTLLVTEGLMQIITYITENLLIAIVNVALIMGINMIFSGFMVKSSELNMVTKGYFYANFSAYSFQNYMVNTFKGIHVKGDFFHYPIFLPCTGEQVLKGFDMQHVNIYTNFGILIAFGFAFRLIAFAYSHFKHNGKK